MGFISRRNYPLQLPLGKGGEKKLTYYRIRAKIDFHIIIEENGASSLEGMVSGVVQTMTRRYPRRSATALLFQHVEEKLACQSFL